MAISKDDCCVLNSGSGAWAFEPLAIQLSSSLGEGEAPTEALETARRALVATKLWDSFGCVDLLRKPTGAWVILEVGTDGLFNHVDRDVGDQALERELHQRVADAFWKAAERL